jgi:hypothetical protein
MNRPVRWLPWPLLCAAAALAGEPPKSDPKAAPAEQYEALVTSYSETRAALNKAAVDATDAERKRIGEEKKRRASETAVAMLGLAEKHPKDPAAVDALVWVCTKLSPDRAEYVKALDRLRRDHLRSDKVGPVCRALGFTPSAKGDEFLRAVLDAHPDRKVLAEACLALAESAQRKADLAALREQMPDLASRIPEGEPERELLKAVPPGGPAPLRREAERLFGRVARDFGDVADGDTTFGKVAEGFLFEVRNLVPGKPAPEVEGEDVGGQRFKLSDYRGKVVVLDFWGHW